MKNQIPALLALTLLGVFPFLSGCTSPKITAVNLNPNSKEPKGIPYYLPKPYLVVSKNVRFISAPVLGPSGQAASTPSNSVGGPSPVNAGTGKTTANTNQNTTASKTGATSPKGTNSLANILSGIAGAVNTAAPSGSNSSTPGGSNANNPTATSPGTMVGSQVQEPPSIAVVPPASISDGLVPQEFFTYQIVYLPDTQQKYGLRIKGGSGELKATADLVNGWMFTGPGSFDVNNSTTAQNVTASGQAIGSVVQSVGQIALNALGIPTLGGGAKLTSAGPSGSLPNSLTNYAELYVFEFVRTNGVWTLRPLNDGKPIVQFNRDLISLEQTSGPTTANTPNLQPDLAAQMTYSITNSLKTKWTFPTNGLNIEILRPVDSDNVTISIFRVQRAASANPNPGIQDLTNDVQTAAQGFLDQNKDRFSKPRITFAWVPNSIGGP